MEQNKIRRSARRWREIEEAYENGEIVEGTIIRRIKGGMIVDLIDGLEAFLPDSQIDVRPIRDFDAYLEKRMEFEIVRINPSNKNVVISHTALIKKELEAQRNKILSSMEVGQVLEGTVKNIVDFGVFIDLGGVDGLLHITDLSWGRVSHPSELVELDEKIKVVVLDYDKERQRISLGLKQLQPHPWENIDAKFEESDTVEGKVVSITDYGAFVELEKGIEGLVHTSEMDWTDRIRHPRKKVSLGQLVNVKILNIDHDGKEISLSMEQLENNPWVGLADRYPPGTVLRGTVRNITNFGVFVQIEPGIDGLVHISDLSYVKKIGHPSEVTQKGQEMDVVILKIDEDSERLSLGHKQLSPNPWKKIAEAFAKDTSHRGSVSRVEEKGVVVELPMGVEAFISSDELMQAPEALHSYYRERQELDLRVSGIDPEAEELVLKEIGSRSIEQRPYKADRQEENGDMEDSNGAGSSVDQTSPQQEQPPTGPAENPIHCNIQGQPQEEVAVDAIGAQRCTCGSTEIGRTGRTGNGRKCRECLRTWYISHCWNCHETVDSRSEDTNRCAMCGWYACPACGECREQCEQSDDTSQQYKPGHGPVILDSLLEDIKKRNRTPANVGTGVEGNGHSSDDQANAVAVKDLWQKLQSAHDAGTSVPGRIGDRQPNGIGVKLFDQIRALIPTDEVQNKVRWNLETYRDMEAEFKITRCDPFSRTVVVVPTRPLSEANTMDGVSTNFAHVCLTTTGARQIIQVLDKNAGVPDDDRRCRDRAGSLLQRHVLEADALFISRMEDDDRDSGMSMIGLRIESGEKSVDLILTPKQDCLLVIGARSIRERQRIYEKEVDLNIFVESSNFPPISPALWDEVQTLETKEERAEEVDKRLKQWSTYLEVQKREAEKQQFTFAYQNVRHTERTGRIRLELRDRPTPSDRGKLERASRNWVGIKGQDSRDVRRAVATGEVKKYVPSKNYLVVDLDDDDTDRVNAGRLTLPPQGFVEHRAAGSLSMIQRQQQAIETLKLTGGEMEKLDLFLFGSDEEIDPPVFGPVKPLSASECLDPEHTNEEQRLAVANALACPDMFFMQGPPGTGKTTFIAELCYQLARRGKRALVASQANLAVDNALSRLQASRDILAVRVAREDKVEEEGKPFIGNNAVRTWLNGVTIHSQQRIKLLSDKVDALTLASAERTVLEEWAHEADAIHTSLDLEQTKLDRYTAEVDTLQKERVEALRQADSLNELADAIRTGVLLRDAHTHGTTDHREKLRETWNDSKSSSGDFWHKGIESTQRFVGLATTDPWKISSKLSSLQEKLENGGEYSRLAQQTRESLHETAPLRDKVKQTKAALKEARKHVHAAQKKIQYCQKYQELLDGRAGRVLDPELIDQQHLPIWHGSAARASEARSLLAGSVEHPGVEPDRPLRVLIRDWREAETAGRGKDAEHLLQQLHFAWKNAREKTRTPLLGWFYTHFWFDGRREQFKEAIYKVEDHISGTAPSDLGDKIRREIRHFEEKIRQSKKEAEDAKAQYGANSLELGNELGELTYEAGVVSDRLKSQYGPLLRDADSQGERAIEQFLSLSRTIAELPERVEKWRREAQQAKSDLEHTLEGLEKRLAHEALLKREAAAEILERIQRREKTASSVEERIQALGQRHKAARGIWEQVCSKDPDIAEDFAAASPSVEWLAQYISVLDDVDVDRLKRVKRIVKDWNRVILEGDGKIGRELKNRFFRNANVVGVTCARAGKKNFRSEYGTFDVVIVDEVSKATPTELLMPTILGSKVALVGDHRQLAPIFGQEGSFEEAAEKLGIHEKELKKNLGRSLFKERFEYFSANEQSGPERTSNGELAGRRTVMLTKQYRMHSQIMQGINQFYDEKLELGHVLVNGNFRPLNEVRQHQLEITPWVSSNDHLVWVDTPIGGDWGHTQDGPTRYNDKEMDTTLHMLKSLASFFQQEKREPLSVGITSVYAAQVRRLRQRMSQLDLPPEMRKGIRVSTVDRFQGMERDIMFLNLVLNRRNLPPSRWLRTPERINVAMSRARHLLVIVGSKHNYVEVAGTSPAYARFFDVALKYGHRVRANHIIS